jgi:hypothetical protein
VEQHDMRLVLVAQLGNLQFQFSAHGYWPPLHRDIFLVEPSFLHSLLLRRRLRTVRPGNANLPWYVTVAVAARDGIHPQ